MMEEKSTFGGIPYAAQLRYIIPNFPSSIMGTILVIARRFGKNHMPIMFKGSKIG